MRIILTARYRFVEVSCIWFKNIYIYRNVQFIANTNLLSTVRGYGACIYGSGGARIFIAEGAFFSDNDNVGTSGAGGCLAVRNANLTIGA